MNIAIRAVRVASLAFACIVNCFIRASLYVGHLFYYRGRYVIDLPQNNNNNATTTTTARRDIDITAVNNSSNNNSSNNNTSPCPAAIANGQAENSQPRVERADLKPKNTIIHTTTTSIIVPARNDVESGSPSTTNNNEQAYDMQSPQRQVLRRLDAVVDDERGLRRCHDTSGNNNNDGAMDDVVSSPTSSISSASLSPGESPIRMSTSSVTLSFSSTSSLPTSPSPQCGSTANNGGVVVVGGGEIIKGGKKQFFSDLAAVTRADYAVLDGHRYVLPYIHDKRYRYHAPWGGRSLLDVLCTDEDFTRVGDKAYWENEVLCGRILTRSGPIADIGAANDFRWSVGDSIWHQRHTHEPPVGSEEIELIHVDDRHVVVNKPPSMPVHPCGTYKRNSLIFLVAVMHGFRTLHIVHRLDKQTSGVCIFGRSRQAAADLHRRNREHKLRKTYLAEVSGHIAHDTFACNMPLGFCNGRAVVDHVSGKEAYTSFRKIKYIRSTNSTLLEAVPTTGRRHQIRAHLLFLEHPIVDDPLYGNGPPPTMPDPTHNLHHLDVPRGPKILEVGRELKCKDCPHLFMKDVKTHNNPIRLHALMYQGDGFSYRATPPAWARNIIGATVNANNNNNNINVGNTPNSSSSNSSAW